MGHKCFDTWQRETMMMVGSPCLMPSTESFLKMFSTALGNDKNTQKQLQKA